MGTKRLLVLVSATVMVGAALLSAAAVGPAAGAVTPLPTVHHVFIIELENEGFATTFSPGAPAYLAKTLPSMGQLLTQYYGIGHVSADNYIAQISGQAPNLLTQTDCLVFLPVLPALPVPAGLPLLPVLPAPAGQVIGQGCVYPASVPTVVDQLKAKGFSWKAYMEDMGNTPSREPATCAHPALFGVDGTQTATAADQYATRHNPFVYFHSIIDSPDCNANVVPLTGFANDLTSAATTANYSFISPNLCHDGHDAPCQNGEPGGLVSANQFLQTWVPRITSSAAFQQDGLLMVTFDEAGTSDATACCGEQSGPNTLFPGLTGPGGGLVGAVLLSKFITPGTVNATPYNHYSQLRSVEDLFGLDHLGYAGAPGLAAFGHDVFP
jgi:hypothetical protein